MQNSVKILENFPSLLGSQTESTDIKQIASRPLVKSVYSSNSRNKKSGFLGVYDFSTALKNSLSLHSCCSCDVSTIVVKNIYYEKLLVGN